MASSEVIDAQFNRAVEIVQSLPKTGPIQTDYEEKLTMYSLYKQATVGNVETPRPGMWDMLGRAKWDAWAKHRDLDPLEAKWLYVLRKYSDKTTAMTLVQELENYGDFTHLSSNSRFRSADSDTSGSTISEDDEPSYPPRNVPRPRESQSPAHEGDVSEGDDEARDLPVVVEHERAMSQSQSNRPSSSLSSHRYRTPLGTSVVISPPPIHRIPSSQPRPDFATPSAFADPSPISSPSNPTMSSYVGISDPSRAEAATPTRTPSYTPHRQFRGPQQPLPPFGSMRPASEASLERAIENVQVHLAALTERIDSLETSLSLSRSNTSLTLRHLGSPSRHSPHEGRGPYWDRDDLGMWSFVVNPIACVLDKIRELATFFARNEDRSPTRMIIRRLCLDVSFLVCVLAVVRLLWKRSGVRRREVHLALRVLWRAILGAKPDRVMIDQAV
ncbi:hypothetical protein C0993_006998 [Termitomyces sp. T159_Od127]|nr:hypothetical protein C0993_006998 [Termitomyces sp. T159_Od127]